MKSASYIFKFFYHLRMAAEYAMQLCRDKPDTVFRPMLRLSVSKIQWIYTNAITDAKLSEKVPGTIDIIKEKWCSDVLAETSIVQKISLLNDDQMNMLEVIVDELIKGEKIEVSLK